MHRILFILIETFAMSTYVTVLLLILISRLDQALAAEPFSRQLRTHHPAGAALDPALPDVEDFEVQLVLDDDSAEVDFGLVGAGSVPFLWMNRFELEAPMRLEEIWVLFPRDPALENAEIEWVVFQDENETPLDGAQLHRASAARIQATDGVSFSVYPVQPPVELTEPHVYLGVISRFAERPTPPTFPAVLDTDGQGGQSWVGVWQGEPPRPPALPADDETFLIDELIPGYWMIRGFGQPLVVPLEVPALGDLARTLLAVWLALAALLFLRRRRRQPSCSGSLPP